MEWYRSDDSSAETATPRSGSEKGQVREMTRKHFVALAEIVHDAKMRFEVEDDPQAGDVIEYFENKLVGFARRSNPRFDELRFRQACDLVLHRNY